MNHKTHCQIILSHWPTEHRSTTIKWTELIRDPTWNSFGWNAVPPIQFLWPSRTNQIIRLCTDRTGMLFFVWLSSATHDISLNTGVGICSLIFCSTHIDFGGWIILSPRCCLHLCSAQGMKYKAWHREQLRGVSCACQFWLVMTINEAVEPSSKRSGEW